VPVGGRALFTMGFPQHAVDSKAAPCPSFESPPLFFAGEKEPALTERQGVERMPRADEGEFDASSDWEAPFAITQPSK
jgi:hypothetical protein